MLNPDQSPGAHTRAEQPPESGGRSQRPRCVFLQRNHAPTGKPAGDGVSTYLALTFGTLLSSQGTDASFVLTPTGFPPGTSLRSCVSDSIRPFLRLIPSQRGLSSRPLGRSDE